CEHVQPRLSQVRPVLYSFWIPRANRDDHNRSADHSAIGLRLPIMSDKPGVGYFVDIAFERERGDVGFEPADDSSGLRAAPLIRLLELDVLAGLFLPEFLKRGDNTFAVGFTRSRVASKNQGDFVAALASASTALKRDCNYTHDH